MNPFQCFLALGHSEIAIKIHIRSQSRYHWKKLETLKKYLLASGLDVALVMGSMNFLGDIALKRKRYYFAKK